MVKANQGNYMYGQEANRMMNDDLTSIADNMSLGQCYRSIKWLVSALLVLLVSGWLISKD